MIKQIRANGLRFILVSGLLYFLLCVSAMLAFILGPEFEDIDAVNRAFWVVIMLAFGTPAVIAIQYIGNMYSSRPVSDLRAAALILASAMITLWTLKYLSGVVLGS